MLCPKCFATIDDDCKFCTKCGTRIEMPKPQPPQPQQPVQSAAQPSAVPSQTVGAVAVGGKQNNNDSAAQLPNMGDHLNLSEGGNKGLPPIEASDPLEMLEGTEPLPPIGSNDQMNLSEDEIKPRADGKALPPIEASDPLEMLEGTEPLPQIGAGNDQMNLSEGEIKPRTDGKALPPIEASDPLEMLEGTEPLPAIGSSDQMKMDIAMPNIPSASEPTTPQQPVPTPLPVQTPAQTPVEPADIVYTSVGAAVPNVGQSQIYMPIRKG